MKEETKNSILQTILLVEDRIAEIQESGDLGNHLVPCNEKGLPTEKYMTAATKMRFLSGLSLDLKVFYSGIYPKD